MLNKICVLLTIAAVMICIIVCISGSDSQTINETRNQIDTVSDESNIIIKEDSHFPNYNILLGVILLGCSSAVCGFCIHEIRKDKLLQYDIR